VSLTSPTVEHNVFMYLVYNQERFKIELNQFVKQRDSLLKTEDSSFHGEIQEQFKAYANSVLVDNVTKHLAISSEDAIIVIENLNLDEYLGA
jgi:hypothetical protein